ncbi:hypothetical protein [Streptomyces johnsoniae]|uniref:ESX-1 secretion-associated protein n=1 Tax=Streptomyces johnsoniae TaxID=3075532 RepID=A0ABU2S1Z3_9ACTN|nr:hypothetical protein [Streptomyces sp. DSM 41886]MDT0441615.1 hypothetical protein [Streptomyces sp. DSM 41886]
MSFDAEWAGLQAAARDELTHTRLNSRGDGSGGDLEHREGQLTPIQGDADALANDLDQNGSLAHNATYVAGILLRTPGLDTGVALTEVADRWQSQAAALHAACLRIAGHVGDTVRTHAAGELETTADIRNASAVRSNAHLDAL